MHPAAPILVARDDSLRCNICFKENLENAKITTKKAYVTALQPEHILHEVNMKNKHGPAARAHVTQF
jgi:hypothetical protein